LGAVLKGQDLIAGARSKKFVTWEKHWEVSQWTYFDRKGRFAGDAGKNGVIGDQTGGGNEEQTSGTSAVGQIGTANFINPPPEPITMGSYTFCMKMGYDTEAAVTRNVIVICKPIAGSCNATCTTVFTADELVYMEAVDTSIDGVADAGDGNVRAATAVTTVVGSNNRVVTAVTEEPASAVWNDTTHLALVYYFDRPR